MSKHHIIERAELEEESYFVSMTDMMVGLLFIFILILMYFALQYQKSTENLQNADSARSQILEKIKDDLERQNIKVSIDEKSGILRLPEESLQFLSGKADIRPEDKPVIHLLADALDSVLPCYAKRDGDPQANCAPTAHTLEAVFIEGHTDDKPVGKSVDGNWDLSVARSVNTYKALIADRPGLSGLKNEDEQYLLSVSGYGQYRPIQPNDTDEHRTMNRRIDLRFVMSNPKAADSLPVVTQVKEKLE